jgi:hypothetical protein
VFSCLPLQLIGISDWIMLSTSTQTVQFMSYRAKRFLSGMHFVSVLVPTFLIYWVFSRGVFDMIYLIQSSIFLLLACTLRFTRLGPKLDLYVAPNVTLDDRNAPPWSLLFGHRRLPTLQWVLIKFKPQFVCLQFVFIAVGWTYSVLALCALRVVQVSVLESNRLFSKSQAESLVVIAMS